ncbi:endonuclease domain-containing protein [Caulobacter sp.]|uniref:endonuclease domain-containing protein n=1 Tax=Caulobacter sp. TaxID=78 RepID=UPI003BAA2DD9
MDRTATARRLRQTQTMPEARLWALVRGRRLEGFKFRRQVPIDRYFAHFACVEARLVVELDGPVHAAEEAEILDMARTEVIEACGYTVLRFQNELVMTDPGGVGEAILAALRTARA